MGLLRRRRRSRTPDDVLSFLTVDQAARLRALVQQAFAEEGREVTVGADHLVDADGNTYGLGNLAGACHYDDRGERAWPEVVRQHVQRLIRLADEPSPFERLSRDEVLAATHLRLLAAEDVAPHGARTARDVAPGLVEVLALDLPESVLFFRDEDVETFGPEAELRATGLANLRRVEVDDHEVLSRDGGSVHVLAGESMFVASTMLLLDEVVARHDRAMDPELGAFVSVPFRHQLNFHALRDTSALPSLEVLTNWTVAGWSGAPGPTTPDVYWWRPGDCRRLTEVGPEGILITVGPELEDVLDRLDRSS